MTHAILVHVAQMPNVIMEFAHVYRSIKAILIEVVDPNVYLIRTVQGTKHVLETNVLIPVLELVEQMQSVM